MIRRIFRGRRDELGSELQYHFDRLVEDYLAEGLEPEEARRRARIDFGGMDQVKEECRDAAGGRWIEDLVQDLRFGVRLLRKEPGYAVLAVLALALGIGANNTVFTFVNGATLRGLPAEDPERIVAIRTRDAEGRPGGWSYRDLEDYRDGSTSFTGIAGFSRGSANVTDRGRAPERFVSLYVSAEAFRLLGARPILGRDFLPEDDRPGATPTVLLGASVWKSRYGGDPGIVGRTIGVDGVPTVVVGVMPEGFRFDYHTELWQPLSQRPDLDRERRDARALQAFGRLAEGARHEAAEADLQAIAARLARDHPSTNAAVQPRVEPFTGTVSGTPMMVALLGAVAFLLLIACANVASLLLARSANRWREISIRLALGASRGRILRQLLAESALLTLLAGGAGLGLSIAGVRLFARSIEDIEKPYWIHWTMDGTVFAFLSAICLGTGILFSLAPALQLAKIGARVVKEGGRTATGSLTTRRWTRGLIVAEVAWTMVLLAGAGLMVRSYLALHRRDRLVNVSGVTMMALRLPESSYPTADERRRLLESLEERLGGIGAISAAAVASAFPFAGAPARELEVEGRPPRTESAPSAAVVSIGGGYFEIFGLPLVRGRGFGPRDGTAGQDSAIVNQLFASRFFPGESPLGRRIRLRGGELRGSRATPWLTIVGVVPTVRQRDMNDLDPVVYLPQRADPTPGIWLFVRSGSETSALTSLLREEVRGIDPDLPLFGIMPMEVLLSQSRWPYRVFGTMLLVFAAIALPLAALGLYAVVAYSVSRRTQEIGVRIAFGAEPRQVGWLVGRELWACLAAGLALGIAGALACGRALGTVLVETSPADPVTLIAITGLLVLVFAAAWLVPARRASRLDPVIALRHE